MKQLILSAIFIATTMLGYSQKTLEGKIYEALIGIEEVDGFETIGREEVEKEVDGVIFWVPEGAPIVRGIGGRVYYYCVLTFEKDSVLISFRNKKQGKIFRGEEDEILSERGKFLYRKRNRTIKIENSMIYSLESGKDFILTIEDDGHTLLVDEKTNPFYWNNISFHYKAVEYENTQEPEKIENKNTDK